MTANELRELADALSIPTAYTYGPTEPQRQKIAAYLRACADALERGPVGWISPSNPWKDGSDPRQLVQDYEASGGYGFSADTALSRGWAALYPVAMPAQLALRLPEPMTGEEIYASDELMRLNGRKLGLSLNELAEVVNAIEAEVLRRVKEANNG